MDFGAPGLLTDLSRSTTVDLDAATFGIVAMTKDGIVNHYNATEARLAGLSPQTVLNRHFFTAVAPCTNNYMVAQRFELEAELDETIDYVFTLRMKPSRVRLRMLKSAAQPNQFLLVERR